MLHIFVLQDFMFICLQDAFAAVTETMYLIPSRISKKNTVSDEQSMTHKCNNKYMSTGRKFNSPSIFPLKGIGGPPGDPGSKGIQGNKVRDI